ncbi:winged helix-turn-helix domain-containing protein [Haloarchaeobius sp. FL176]|uniref:ArsR/SmtB family transcription factor n=1 Tax=Haloarchaeobius sp. FL176 TaxID=2967129 RepID=UPI00214730E0|nr:winged helix-turn-helix domain-containing protein [Haloarchaeobius sp. FL176]
MSNSALENRATEVTKPSNGRPELPGQEEQSVDPDELLALLSDDHARAILKTISEQGRPARNIAERTDLSRATVYRRLNRLEDAGLVDTTMAYHSEGHHRKHYFAEQNEFRLSFEEGDIAVEATAL